MQSAQIRSFEYRNAFLYVVIREEQGRSPDSYLYCCGINLSRFCRLSWRKGGICSNPAVRGIQLLLTHVSAFAAEQGMIVERAKGIDSAPFTPHGEGWYHQDPLRLQRAAPERIRELLEFSVMDLVRTVLVVCVPGAPIPSAFPDAAAMQKFLESLSVAEERERVMAYEKENLAVSSSGQDEEKGRSSSSGVLTQLRAYHYLSGVLANQQRDLFCGQCSAWNSTLNAAREGLKQFEAEHGEELRGLTPEAVTLLAEVRSRLAGLPDAADPAGQKKAGNCKLPQGVCLVKSSRAILEKI